MVLDHGRRDVLPDPLIEWPFMAFLLRKNPGWMKRSAGAALGVQSVSYLVVFGWYWLASGTSLYTTAQVVRPQDLSLPESVLSETPFGAWAVRNVVHLPSDKVLFQLGEDQICGFDPLKRQVALLWRGMGAGAGHWEAGDGMRGAEGEFEDSSLNPGGLRLET